MSYRAQVSDTATLILNGGGLNSLMVTNVGTCSIYVSENGSVTANADQVIDIGGSLVVNSKSQLWAVCASGLTSSLAITKNVGQRFAYAASSTRALKTIVWADTVLAGTESSYNLTYDNTLASQFSSIQITLTRNSPITSALTANTYRITYQDYTGPSIVNQPQITDGNKQEVLITHDNYSGTTPQALLSVTFATRGYGGKYAITPLLDTNSNLVWQVTGQATTITAPKVWVNPRILSALASAIQWSQAGTLYSKLDTTTYSGNPSAPNTYDFLLPPTNGYSQLSVNYTINGTGAPVSTWQLVSYVGYAQAPETFGKVPTSNILSTYTGTGAGQNFTSYFNFIPKNPTYLRYTLGGLASMTSMQITIGGEQT